MAAQNDRSFASKVSSAVKANQNAMDSDSGLAKAVGSRIKIVTSSPESTLEGTLFTADKVTQLVAINTNPGSSSSGDYHIIPISRIKSFNILSTRDAAHKDFANALPPIGRLDVKALEKREEAAIRRVKEKNASRGKGVTKEAQEIFDALARTLPTRWHETSIIVNDTVRIDSPYGLDDCRAPKEQQNALTRVKRVLENERRKIAERNNRGSGAVESPSTRKGG